MVQDCTRSLSVCASFGNGDKQLSGVLLGTDPARFLAP
jgi:hypothetical protein